MRCGMTRGRYMNGTSLGRQSLAPIPPAVTSARGEPDPPSAEEILAGIRNAIQTIQETNLELPSVLVLDDDLPDGLEVSAGEIRFMTISRLGLERIKAEAKPYIVSDPTRLDVPTLHGLPIVDLAELERGGSPRGRALAAYYRAAIAGYRRGLES